MYKERQIFIRGTVALHAEIISLVGSQWEEPEKQSFRVQEFNKNMHDIQDFQDI